MTESWKESALSLATTPGVTYVFFAIFDSPPLPFGFLAAIELASPVPVSGSPLAFMDGIRAVYRRRFSVLRIAWNTGAVKRIEMRT